MTENLNWNYIITRATQSVAYPLAWKFDLWPWKSIGFQILLRTKYVPSLVKIHWRMLILETMTFELWPWKSIGFQTRLRTKYVPSLVKIHWRMLILECSQGCYGRTVALLRNFVGEGIMKNLTYIMWNP